MNNVRYNRSSVYDFTDLSSQQQEEVIRNFGLNLDSANVRYVMIDNEDGTRSPLPLNMFQRFDHPKMWHGGFPQNNFGGYYVRLSRDNEEVLVAERYN